MKASESCDGVVWTTTVIPTDLVWATYSGVLTEATASLPCASTPVRGLGLGLRSEVGSRSMEDDKSMKICSDLLGECAGLFKA